MYTFYRSGHSIPTVVSIIFHVSLFSITSTTPCIKLIFLKRTLAVQATLGHKLRRRLRAVQQPNFLTGHGYIWWKSFPSFFFTYFYPLNVFAPLFRHLCLHAGSLWPSNFPKRLHLPSTCTKTNESSVES